MRFFMVPLALVLSLLALAATPVRAAVHEGDVTVTPMVGYHLFESELDLEDSATFGLALGYNVTKNWALELDTRYVPSEVDGWHGADVDTWLVSGNLLYHFAPEQPLVPYLVAGLGGMQYDIEGTADDDEDLVGNIGGGLKFAVARNLNLRFDLRYLLDRRSDDEGRTSGDDGRWSQHVSAMFGLNFQFGSAPAVPAAPPVEPVVTKAATVEPAIPVGPQDSDKDGVLDPDDRCPDTDPGVRVDADGCPADSDGDGVADFRDACVDTPKGAKIDDKGCPFVIKPVETLTLHLLYATGKAQVTPFHYRELEKAFAFIQKYPGHDIVIEGHTDSKGDDASNLRLSQRRAENVRAALIEKYGVDAGRITAKGFGETQPVTTNETAIGREQNRRVVISVMP